MPISNKAGADWLGYFDLKPLFFMNPYEKTKDQTLEALKDRSPEEIKLMIAEALTAAFFASKRLAETGDPFSSTLQTQLIGVAEAFPHGRDASHLMRANMIGDSGVYLGTNGPVVRKGPNVYNPGAQEVKVVKLQPDPERQVGKLVAPVYGVIEGDGKTVQDEPPCCEDETQETQTAETSPPVNETSQNPADSQKEEAPDTTTLADLPDVLIWDPKDGSKPKLKKEQLVKAKAKELAALLSQSELLFLVDQISAEKSGSRAKAALAKRVMIRIKEIEANSKE